MNNLYLADITRRIVGLPMDTTNNAVLDDAFRLTWKALMSHKAIQCAHKSTQVAAVSKPSLVILDVSRSKASRVSIFRCTCLICSVEGFPIVLAGNHSLRAIASAYLPMDDGLLWRFHVHVWSR